MNNKKSEFRSILRSIKNGCGPIYQVKITFLVKMKYFMWFLGPKNIGIEYQHAIVAFNRKFQNFNQFSAQSKMGVVPYRAKMTFLVKIKYLTWFLDPKNIGIEYPHAILAFKQKSQIYIRIFPRSNKGVALKKIPERFQIENFQGCLYGPWSSSCEIFQLVGIISRFRTIIPLLYNENTILFIIINSINYNN